jgi:hypothetical protein
MNQEVFKFPIIGLKIFWPQLLVQSGPKCPIVQPPLNYHCLLEMYLVCLFFNI